MGDTPEIEIDYRNFGLAFNYQFWTVFTIKMRAKSNFVQGSGLSYSEGSVDIMWVDLELGDGIMDGDEIIERRDTNIFTVEFTGSVDQYLKIKWVITPEIPSINGDKLN